MGALWIHGAQRVLGESAGSHAPGAGPKITHHTTEGASAAGAIGAYRATRSWPTMTAEWTGSRLRVFQHMPLNMAARALEHPSGPETNRANTVQIEHVGFTSNAARRAAGAPASLFVGSWPDARWAAIAQLCREIEAATGCRPQSLVPAGWWVSPQRLGGEAYFRGVGHHGHCHVPGNSHVDGTGFQIAKIIASGDGAFRPLVLGASGPDVEALQRATRVRAAACGRKDRMPPVDGVFGPVTQTCAAFVAYVLGVGSSQAGIVKGGLSVGVQRIIRDPGKRNLIEKRRAAGRRAKHCKGGK